VSEHSELPSIVGVDYTSLDSLLASSQWQKADQETAAVMLKIASRVTTGWLREEDIKDFPCQDLQTINDLWVKYSQGRFGFSVQSNVWESIGEDYGKFSDAVGWRHDSDWLEYSQLSFSLQAPVGQMPAAPFFKFNHSPIGWAASLPSKLVDCYGEDF
jgi:hypothetical protein